MTLEIKKYSADRLEDCVSLLADAFVTNPLHLSAFGAGQLDQNRRFFRIGLRHMFFGRAFVAAVDGAIGGYVHFNAAPFCLPPPMKYPPSGDAISNRWVLRIPRYSLVRAGVHLDPRTALSSRAHGFAPRMQRQACAQR